MDIRAQAQKAEQFGKLHHGPRLVLLPNAWDVVSARILEECGHPAIATSSAAVAFSLGYPDGQRISRDEMLEVAGRADLKSDLLQELERQKQTLLGFKSHPNVETDRLDAILEGQR